MNPDLNQKLQQLRSELPIGLTEGRKLLEEMEGDIEKAKQVWWDRVLEEMVAETGAPRETAKIYLVGYLFDKAEAVRKLKEVFGDG